MGFGWAVGIDVGDGSSIRIVSKMELEKCHRYGAKRFVILGGGNSKIFYFHPYLGKIPILTNIFQMG